MLRMFSGIDGQRILAHVPMKFKSRSTRRRQMINASDLAQLGVCEQLIVFERSFGKKRTIAQRKAIERGNAAHAAFLDQAVTTEPAVETSEATRCFIATATFGLYSPETQLLRCFRDDVLSTCSLGRWIIHCYYQASPPMANAIGRSPLLRGIATLLLSPIVWAIGVWLQTRSDGGRQ